MTQEGLKGLALLYMHRDMPLNYDAVIDGFSRVKPGDWLSHEETSSS